MVTFAGKILVAKEKNTVSSVKVNVPPTASNRFSGQRASINAGTVVMCVYEYKPARNPKETRDRGLPSVPYLFILHDEKTWECNPYSYGAVEPSEFLKDKSICFTGEDTVTKGTREYWKALVEAYGGTNVSAVTSSTSFLVMGDKFSKSTKAIKARNRGTVCLTYEEFQKMLNESV